MADGATVRSNQQFKTTIKMVFKLRKLNIRYFGIILTFRLNKIDEYQLLGCQNS